MLNYLKYLRTYNINVPQKIRWVIEGVLMLSQSVVGNINTVADTCAEYPAQAAVSLSPRKS